MSLFKRLGEKSWQTPGVEGYAEPAAYRPAPATIGLFVYFGVITVLFSLMVSAYLVRMDVMAHGAGNDWRPMPEPPLLWINTGILVAGSLAWESARRSARRSAEQRMRLMAVVGGFLGLAFLAGQLLLWRQYQAAGYFLAANPANAFFYLLTAAHGLHLVGGLVACARAVGQSGRSDDRARVFRNIELCALYWHFLLFVWFFLAGLLVST